VVVYYQLMRMQLGHRTIELVFDWTSFSQQSKKHWRVSSDADAKRSVYLVFLFLTVELE